MTTKELIEALQKFPPDAQVGYVFDGCIRGGVKYLWLSRSGVVALADTGQYVENDDLPQDPQAAGMVKFCIAGSWQTPEPEDEFGCVEKQFPN